MRASFLSRARRYSASASSRREAVISSHLASCSAGSNNVLLLAEQQRHFSRGARPSSATSVPPFDVTGQSILPASSVSTLSSSRTSVFVSTQANLNIDFDPPVVITREAVAYAECPFCRARHHMKDMEKHLVDMHGPSSDATTMDQHRLDNSNREDRERSVGDGSITVEAARDMCARRLELYEAFFAERLEKTEEDEMRESDPEKEDYFSNVGRPRIVAASLTLSSSDLATDPNNSAFSHPSTSSIVDIDVAVAEQQEKGIEAKVPVLVEGGGYVCKICCPNHDSLAGGEGAGACEVFKTRDAILKHLYTVHEDDDDVEDIEALVPKQGSTSTPPRPSSSASISAGVNGSLGGGGGLGGGRKPVLMGQAAKLEREKRKLLGIKDEAVVIKEYVFKENEFPCEICGKVFGNESQLLVHIEGKHGSEVGGASDMMPTVDASSPATSSLGGESPKSAAELVADLQRREATLGAGIGINCKCEHCPGKQTVYKSVSALFSHLVAKHPTVDALAYATRMLDNARTIAENPVAYDILKGSTDGKPAGDAAAATHANSFECEFCSRQFGSQEALTSHIQSKHQGVATVHTTTTVVGNNHYWCNECDRGFGSGQGLLSHLQGKHGLVAEPMRCVVCRRHLADPFALDEHVELAHPEFFKNRYRKASSAREKQCIRCPRIFLSEEERRIHVERYHPEALQELDEICAHEKQLEEEHERFREMRRNARREEGRGRGGGGGRGGGNFRGGGRGGGGGGFRGRGGGGVPRGGGW